MSTGLRFTLEVDGLPPDAFAVVSFHLNQSLSSLFSLDLSLVSQQFLSLEFQQILDKMAYLTIWQGDDVQRRVKGVVTWFELGENDKNQKLYSMKVCPPLWRTGLRQNFRIFQNEDIESILGTILQENGVTEWSPLFSEPHPSREFCVQYGETDYDFLCRMAAEEGIFFYEEHAYKSTDQSLVLCDTVRHLPESFEIPWNPNTRTEVSTLCISQFRYSAQIRPSSVVTKDYTFKRPGWAGRFEQEGQHQDYQRTQYEVYDYPGRFKSAHGQNFARWQMDGWRNNAETARGMGRSPEIWPGRRIVLTGHPQANLNREWQVVASELHGEQPQAVPGRQGAGTALENHFAVIPADRTWRPQPLLKPLVDGPQSAVVTGPAGEEIFCDEHGRVRVKFNWDRYNPADQDSSCWIRVAQAWAGTGFGHLAIPRVGQEVIVDFLNGDPDQPIIMGRTYHQENRTPGSLPGTKTQMTIRSKTYMGSGFNELKFDDATGREQVYIHAQKNMDNGVVWTMEYGPFDLPVARTDGEGHRWQYRYDKDTLQLTEVINPQGESYLYVLDNCGRVTEEHDWGGVVWRYRYDADGLCTARVNGLEETILYSRDAAGRLAEIITPEGKTQYAYDKSGRLTGIFSPDGTSQRTGYDERGRVNVTTQGRRAIEYHYPDEHTVIRCILPPEDERDRHPDESLLKTTYRYNAAGELTEVILPGDETLTFSRDEAGREVFRHSNRGFACEQGWNAASQLVTQRAGFFPEETTWGGLLPSLVREYRYDSAGNVSAVTSREDYGRETRREYRLDRNGQVTAVTASGTGLGYGEGDESYGYDSCGYLKAQSAGRHRISEETDQYAGGHRLKQAGNTQYDYDAAGRMVSRTRHRDGYRPETERFRWDSRDQLTGYCSAQGEQWEYRHDASGRRTEKRCDRKKIRFTYLWDGDSIAEIREYRDDKLYSVRHLVFNGFELISQQFSRVRQAHPSVAPQWVTRTNHAVSDLTGRPLMLFNSEGKTVWRPGQTSLWGLALSLPADTGYPDPRGELDPEAAPGLLYAGQWQDVESGLCYNRFRYYEPETGMYLVSDPLGLQGGEQTYRYVPNPLRWIDPLGLNKGASLSKMMNSSSDLMGLRRQPQNFWRLYRGKDI
ncbi:type VI secretion system tip protein TssI/VgrG [Escherichia coli]|uniref:type VI secretion system tip protein TssI/VgrG n=2 Tax=Escherichia coli TaxID=562 RepID=UPI00398B9987